MMNFCWVTVYVTDFERSLKFYNETLGLKISSLNEDIKMAMLGEDDQPKLEIMETSEKIDTSVNLGFSIGLEVESLESIQKVLDANNIPVTKGPVSPAPYIRFMFVNDPDGYEVQLVEFIK